ncbi:MAG: leucine-rich repeat protein [Paludibacteraceae bacterium]|nr:leucine-rich repeat protein [Paludibacteraceae bacterium]
MKKVFIALCLLCLYVVAWGQIGGDYDPESPSDPGTPVKTYALTLNATPSNGGSFNTTAVRLESGETYTIRAYPNTDYRFIAWLCEGDTLSKSTGYTYTMPAHDVRITGVFEYHPVSPSDPQQPDTTRKYQLFISASPANGGSFNISNAKVAEGSHNQLQAYSNTDFVFKHWIMGDSVLSTAQSLDFVMPKHDVRLAGVFEYNPGNPGDPNTNPWNAATGEVIIDDFVPGYLRNAISSATGNNSSAVLSIMVVGIMNSYDFEAFSRYSNCANLDLSRVSGITTVPSNAFSASNFNRVVLPATIESLGYRSFANCANLTSIVLYAMTPPTLNTDVFSGVSDGLLVYVPAAAIPQYQNETAWSGFTLLPIQEDILNLEVSLPEDADIADFTNMWLELTNTKNGQRIHYVMTDRRSYTFANIIRNTTWNVTLRNERGDVFGQILNVQAQDEDISVSFTSLLKPQNLSLRVLTPDSVDITEQVQVVWTDSKGNYLAQARSLVGLPTGYSATYTVSLPQRLAMVYATPPSATCVLTDESNEVFCRLCAIPNVHISGTVTDASTGLPMCNATVSASQTFAGKYSKTLGTQTDAKGVYTLDIANVPTSLSVSASNYVSQSCRCDSLLSGQDTVAIPVFALRTISGATIALGFTYTDLDGNSQNWYRDYNNIDYSIFNLTTGKAIDRYTLQYPQIVITEEVADGDLLRLTVTSRTGSFMPVSVVDTLADQKATATFDIVALGRIESSFASSKNSTVAGILYDSNGKWMNTYEYTSGKLSVSNLPDGRYILVSMGSSRFFNTIYDLAKLPQTGLVKGVDYVEDTAVVRSGEITTIAISEVPTLDESKLYYTGDKTQFSVNKPSIVVGNYLTLSGTIDFKPTYSQSVSNVQMIIDLPESCEFVSNSVMIGTSIGNYTLNGSQLTIPLMHYTDRVRFCVIPTEGGDCAPTAFVQFDLQGTSIMQPIGSAHVSVQDLSVSVPSTVANPSIPVSGTAVGVCDIEIFDGNVLIGQTKSLANGTWATTYELSDASNLSVHAIHAKVTTQTGVQLISESKNCVYDMNAIELIKVTMYHMNPEKNMQTAVYNFQNPSVTPNKWTVYYPNKAFTYTIEFTNNSPTKVSNVVLYVHTADNEKLPFAATYNSEKDFWYVNCNLGNKSDQHYPINVSVSYTAITELDSMATLSIFEETIKKQDDYNIEITNVSADEDYYYTDYIHNGSNVGLISNFSTIDTLPCSITPMVDTVFDNFSIYSDIDYVSNTLNVYIPKLSLTYLSDITDTILIQYLEWADEICTSNFLRFAIKVENRSTSTNNIRFRAPLQNYLRRSLYFTEQILGAYDSYLMEREVRERLEQLADLSNRLDKLDCMDESIKDDIRDNINRLFEQYFDIKETSNLMQDMDNEFTSPLYAINFAGGWLEFAAEIGFATRRRQISNFIAVFENACPPPFEGNDGGDYTPYNPDDEVQIDPSGYVYEGVSSNRLEGVTATIYYKEMVEDMYGDLHENIVKWDAEAYAQENPLFTDENGLYAWDVPQGLWQVKFEKQGYETTHSDWLPVPPPQLDVNVAMKQNVQPMVRKAGAYEDAVEVEFDKYMLPEQLNTDNIIVMQGDSMVAGTIQLLDEEVSYAQSDISYASKVRFQAAAPFSEPIVTLIVSNRVKSYAGVRMQDNYSQTFAVEQEIKQILCDSVKKVGYCKSTTLSVQVLPATAAARKVLRAQSSSDMMVSLQTTEATIDNNGRAVFTLSGNLPGTAAILFDIEGTDKTAQTMVNVVPVAQLIPTITVVSADTLRGTVHIDQKVNEDSIAVISATPLFGYHFTHWNDGNTDNPRTIKLAGDSTLVASFDLTRFGLCGDALYWEYSDSVVMVTGAGEMYHFTATTMPWLLLRDSITTISISREATTIGEAAFYGSNKVDTIFSYALVPPICGDSCFYLVPQEAQVFVPNGSLEAYKAAEGWRYFFHISEMEKMPETELEQTEFYQCITKYVRNGVLYIRKGNRTYNLLGNEVR